MHEPGYQRLTIIDREGALVDYFVSGKMESRFRDGYRNRITLARESQ